MKKRFLAMLTVLVLTVLMTAAVAATPSMDVYPATGVDLTALEEGNTFDVYVVVTPFNKIGTSATANYVYRVPEDTNQGKVPAAASNKLTNMKYALTWDKTSLEVASVVMYTGNPSTTDQDAGNGYKFAYLAKTAQTTAAGIQHATVTGVGSGELNTGILSIDFGDTATGGFLVRNETAVPSGAVAVVTFRVVSGAQGGASNVTLTNTYKYDGTEKRVNASPVGVTVLAGCEHVNKTALTPDELAAAGKENVTATCLVEGVTWYNCADCNKVISITTNKLPHDYSVEKYLTGKEPTCMTAGQKAMYCSTEGCTEYDESTVTTVDALGHDFADENYAYLAPTCTDDGYDFYYCTRCNYLSPDKVAVVAYKYENGKFYTPAGAEVSIPDGVKLAALGHNWVFSRTEGDVSYYTCTRNCGVAEKAIGLADTVRYVSNNGTGDGLSVTAPTNFKKALKDFSSMPEGVECTIFLVGTVNLTPNQESSFNTVAKSFEEPKHDAHITITTAPGEPKATMFFPFSSVSQYHLYGPTTFDNIIISSDAAGTTSGSSASVSFFGRGFDIEMTENIEMASTAATPTIPYSKSNGNFSYAVSSITVNIPACKVYLCGGFYPGALYEGANGTEGYTANVIVNGGSYWVVAGGSRSAITTVDCDINISVGGNAVIGQLVPINTSPDANVTGTVANIHYYGGTVVLAYRAEMQKRSNYTYTVNHFFHNGCGSMTVGDFMMGATSDANKHWKNVNCYYSINDTASPSAEDFGLAFIAKGEKLEGGITLSEKYYEETSDLTFPEWCGVYGGGHDVVGNKCSFCGITVCATHTPEMYVVSAPDCITVGIQYERCSVCYTRLGDDIITPIDPDAHTPETSVREANCIQTGYNVTTCTVCNTELSRVDTPIAPDVHNYEWQFNNATIESKCLWCGYVQYTYSGDTSKIYVSDNGYAGGGFSADYPLNDFEAAQKIAAACGTDATIYVVGSITIENNFSSTHTVYAEHPHTNTITICGYKNSGVIKFPSLPDKTGKVIYAMNGDVTFENIEFTSWNAADGVSKADGFFYVVAQHNNLVFGKNVTTDYSRNENSNKNTCSMVIVGGCYYNEYHADGTHTSSANCPKTDTNVTFYSGAFYQFLGGSVSGTCGLLNGTVYVNIYGDVSFRDYFAMGGFERNIGDAVLTIKNGSLSTAGAQNTGGYISFAGVNSSANPTTTGLAKDVTIKIYNGSLIANNFVGATGVTSMRPIGAGRYDANGKVGTSADPANHDITMLVDSLTICYDPADGSAVSLVNLLKTSYATYNGTHNRVLGLVAFDGTECTATSNAKHVQGAFVKSEPSTCLAQGYDMYTCTACGKDYTVARAAVSHALSLIGVSSSATCIDPQIDKYACTNVINGELCGYTEFVENTSVPADPAKHYYDNGVCAHCNQSVQDLCTVNHADLDDPNLTATAVVAGCGRGVQYVCTAAITDANGNPILDKDGNPMTCGKSWVVMDSADHAYTAYTVTVAPTATEPGVKTRHCKHCNKVETAIIYADGGAVSSAPIATDASGNLAGIEVVTNRLSKIEKEVLNSLIQDKAYGSEIKVSYQVEGNSVTNIKYSIPLPAEYADMHNVKVIVKDDEGTLHEVEFTVDKGYIVFTF